MEMHSNASLQASGSGDHQGMSIGLHNALIQQSPTKMSDSAGSHSPKSQEGGGYDGLKLTLVPSSNNHHEEQHMDDDLEALADDLELLEYQRSRSTPKIEIDEFGDDDEKSQAFRERQEKQKQEMFTQFYETHVQNRIKNPKYYTLEEVAQHNSELDAWSVIDGKIFNLTPFIPMHPGGEKIVKSFGLDVSELWHTVHKDINLDDTVVALLFEGYLKQAE
eukprot:403370534